METSAERQTTSSKIRALHAEGHDYAEIARILDIRYQHVHNVLGNKYVTANRQAGAAPEYESAESFIDRCFTRGLSYLWPDVAAWDLRTLQDYIDAVKASGDDPGSFFDRWEQQLAGQPPDVYRLAADLLLFYYLFPHWVRKETKIENVMRTAAWGLPEDPPDRSMLESTFGKGIGGVGTHYFATQAYQILYLAQFALEAKTRNTDLSDPMQVQALADDVLKVWKAATETRHALLHFMFPDLFEPIVSNRHKAMIVQVFSKYVKRDADADASLRDIRTALSTEYGDHFSFYEPRIKTLWDTSRPASTVADSVEDSVEAALEKGDGYGLSDLKRDTLWSEELLNELRDALEGPLPVVLAGPPGTGKTWVAKCMVRYLTQDEPTHSRLVQFHPSFAYEQFMEGLQPVLSDGVMAFKPVPGVVVSMARSITPTDPTHYLIIDEMNRANLPRVLGELMYLFEYRGEAVQLPYTGTFELPRNLRFIGTMNTADRSIRSIDAALRRRFEIFQCFPDASILEYYYQRHICDIPDLVQGFSTLNDWLRSELGPHQTIGHTFFMKDRLSIARLRQIWSRQVKPLLDEYFFDDPGRLNDIAMERFWPSTS